MRQRITLFLFIAFNLNLFSQKIRIDTLFIPIPKNLSDSTNEKLKFPLIKTGNANVDKKVNNDLKNRYTHFEHLKLPSKQALIEGADDQIGYLNFTITFLNEDFISLYIVKEAYGAYMVTAYDYFTYNLKTGSYVTINDIVDLSGEFKTIVFTDKTKQYEKQRKELKSYLDDKDMKLDTTSYKWALDDYNECDNNFQIDSFVLYPEYVEIIEHCHLPNAIKNLTPIIELKYKYTDIKKYLKNKKLLNSKLKP
jgi:hypothetical protein